MASYNRQHTENRIRKRQYRGEVWAEILVELMNDASDEDDVGPLAQIIHDSRRLLDLCRHLSIEELGKKGADRSAEATEVIKLQRLLHRTLEKFKGQPRPFLGQTPEGESFLGVEWELLPDSSFALGLKTKPHPQFLFALVHAIEDGTISKVERCDCGHFFFQRFHHQKFCSSKCRIKTNLNSESAKAYRRKKQREYYQLHRNKNVK